MKKLSTLLCILIIASCAKKNNYTTFSGQIKNSKDSVLIITGENLFKEIKINKNGKFNDTLIVNKKGHYTINLGSSKKGLIYLDNGYNLKLTAEANPFFESFSYEGKGAATNNFILTQFELSRNLGDPSSLYILNEENFKKKIKKIKYTIDSTNTLYSNKGVDTAILNNAIRTSSKYIENVQVDYNRNHKSILKEKMNSGKLSPVFKNYIDLKGEKKSLSSYRGKFVYINIWTTWNKANIKEIPSLKLLKKQYKNKNIEFVNICIDEHRKSGGSWETAEKKWRDFIKAKQLSGTQLWAGQDYSFQQAYQINATPRFILIDTEGKIVNANAPRPSEPRLKELFTSLGI